MELIFDLLTHFDWLYDITYQRAHLVICVPALENVQWSWYDIMTMTATVRDNYCMIILND